MTTINTFEGDHYMENKTSTRWRDACVEDIMELQGLTFAKVS